MLVVAADHGSIVVYLATDTFSSVETSDTRLLWSYFRSHDWGSEVVRRVKRRLYCIF